MQGVSNGQRALWTFLMFTLVGPFFAAIAVGGVLVLAPVFKLSSLLPSQDLSAGPAAVATFVWSAIPAALAGLGVTPMVLRGGTFGWGAAAGASVIAAALASVVFPIPVPDVRVAGLVLAGLIGLALYRCLLAFGVITLSDSP